MGEDQRSCPPSESAASARRKISGKWARPVPAARAARFISIAARQPATWQESPGHQCRVNGDCARYIELWNLVFIQYNRKENRELEELPSKHVDTGMGLERITAVLQNVLSNYDIDYMRALTATTEQLTGKKYGADPAADISFRVIDDHARAVSFLIADGVMPSNEGRGYVLRRLLRRAARHGRLIGLEEPFLA